MGAYDDYLAAYKRLVAGWLEAAERALLQSTLDRIARVDAERAKRAVSAVP